MTVAELSDDEIAERLAELRSESPAEGGAVPMGGSESTAPLSNATIEEGLAAARTAMGEQYAAADAAAASQARSRYRFVRPLTDAAHSLIDYLQNSEGRFMFGLPELDMMTRGLGPGELSYLIGYTHCVDPETEILTRRGWLNYEQLQLGDDAWSVNTATGVAEWSEVSAVNVGEYSGRMMSLDDRTVSALVTPEHKWPTTSQWNVAHEIAGYDLTKTVDLNTSDYIPRAARGPEPDLASIADVTVEWLGDHPLERLTHEVIDKLTVRQRRRLVDLLFDGPDGYWASESSRRYETIGSEEYAAKVGHLISAAGYAFSDKVRRIHSFGRYNGFGVMHVFTLHVTSHFRWARRKNKEWVDYSGVVWCPTTGNGTWFARRRGTTYFTGNSGKTQVFLTGCINNRDRRILLVTMDETAEQVLTKLVCMRTASNAERLEERVKAGDRDAIDRVHRIARSDFKNLVVVDGGMRLDDLSTVVAEATAYWGGPPEMLGLDYLELLKTDEPNVEGKSQSLKAWVVQQAFPTVCIHQGSRGNSGQGQKLSLNSMKYAGEAEATFVIGVRRLRDDPDMTDDPGVQDTVEVVLLKNKRPPSRTGEYSYYMAPESGMVMPLAQRPETSTPTGLAAVRRAQAMSPGQRNFDGEEE